MIALKHIIWDWNGTILDDRWLTIAAMNSVLATEYGYINRRSILAIFHVSSNRILSTFRIRL